MRPRPTGKSKQAERRKKVRDRIIAAFLARAVRDGPSAVVMADLARELGISTRTLYQHFPSKSDLVTAVMQRWADEMGDPEAKRRAEALPPVERIKNAASFWVGSQTHLSRSFWSEIRRDYPDAARILDRQINESLALGGSGLEAQMRAGLNKPLAYELLLISIVQASEANRCDRLGLSRRQAVDEAIDLWWFGASGET